MSEVFKAIRKAARVLFEEGQTVELRALGVPTGGDWTATFSGYFNDFDALAGAAVDLDRRGAKGTYVTLNPVRPDLLARRKNKVKRCRKHDPLTKNEEIERRRWLPLDFDPVRPAGISSTDEELRAARARAIEAARYLKGKGWPGGLLCESGNGGHLLYRVDLPADDKGLCKRVLKALAEKFSGEGVELDMGVYSAAQIWKLYGTTARKGDETKERPHRRARILRVADELRPVPAGKLQALAIKPTNGHETAGESEGDLPVEEVKKALSCIPPRPDYETWYRIAVAVEDALGGDTSAAVSLLKAWSPEEEPGEYRRKLESGFKEITTGTLIHEAEKHGYKPPWKKSQSSQSVRTNGQERRKASGTAERDQAGETEEETEAAETLAVAPPLPSKVYDWLPPLLREAASTFGERHERDVFLTGALASLSACMPKVRGYYGHVPNALSPHQYTAVVAGAAGGKGPLKEARRLTSKVNQHIKEESEAEKRRWGDEREWAKENDEPFDLPEPPKRSLLLPANTSAAAFHEGLNDRGECALVIETEIDTLTNALGQEWGKFDDTLRKAYHHEPTSYRRKGEGNVTLESPALAVVLSGTPNQFQELMGSTENGLYSRFQLYYFDAPPVWISQRPTADALRRVERFEEYAERILSMWKALKSRGGPLRYHLTDGQWRMHDETFAPLLREAALKKRGHLSDVIKRAGVVAFRIGMTLTVLRAFESGVPLDKAGELQAEDTDVRAGLLLACVYADHSMRFAEAKLQAAEPPDPSTHRIAVMLAGVGEEFTSGEAYEAAEAEGLGVSRRTLREDLKTAEKRKLIRAVKARHWKKTDAARRIAATSASSGSSGNPPETGKAEEAEVPETAALPEKAPGARHSKSTIKNNGHSETGAKRAGSEVKSANNGSPEPAHNGNTNGASEADASSEGQAGLERLYREMKRWKRGPGREIAGLEKKQPVRTPKGAGTVVKLEEGNVYVELDRAPIGEAEAFDPEDIEPLEDAPF